MIICLSNKFIDVKFKNLDEGLILAAFVNDDPQPKVVFPMQMQDKTRNRIELLRQRIVPLVGKKIERMFAVLHEIKDNEWFFILPEKVLEDQNEYNRQKIAGMLQLYISYINNGFSIEKANEFLNSLMNTEGKHLDLLESKYEIFPYLRRKDKLYLGENDRLKKICRFCGKNISQTSFSDKAHAIPVSLGNHKFFNNYECDACNHFFGDKIEPHLKQWIGTMCIFSLTKGRKGVPEMQFKNGVIKYCENEKLMIIVQNSKDLKELENKRTNQDLPLVELGEGVPYIPSYVYRGLVKIALGFIPECYINSFTETIKWLMDLQNDRKLPKVASCLFNQGINPQPQIIIFIRSNADEQDLPFAVVSLLMCGMRYVYIIPFCSEDKEDFTIEDIYEKFWHTFSIYSQAPALEWRFEDLSSDSERIPNLNLHFKQNNKA